MEDQPHRFVQIYVAPLLNAIKGSVLRLRYAWHPDLAHQMAREILARATVAALRRIPYPGIEDLDSVVESQFGPLLQEEVKSEFARIQANPADWILPGNPTALIPQPDLARDHKTLMALRAFLEYSLAFDVAAFADDDVQYIAQYILDSGVLPLPGDETSGTSLGEARHWPSNTVIMEPLIPGTPPEVVPIYDDANDRDIEWSDEARHDAEAFDFITELLSPAYDLPVEAFFARLEDMEWVYGALPKLPTRKQKLIIRVCIHGMAFVAQAPDTDPLELFAALAHLLDLWNQDHPWN